MKIVCLDAATLGDYDLSVFEKFGSLQIYTTTNKEQTIERLKDANVAMTNKVVIDKDVIDACKNLNSFWKLLQGLIISILSMLKKKVLL